MNTLKARSEIETNLKWDLTPLFASEDAFQEACKALSIETDTFVQSYQDSIKNTKDPQLVYQLILDFESLQIKLQRISLYVELSFSVEMNNSQCSKMASMTRSLISELSAKLSFVDSALLDIDLDCMEAVKKLAPEYTIYIDSFLRQKPYRLNPEVEKTLKVLSPTFFLPYFLYETTKGADMSFDPVEIDGVSYPLSYVLYENKYAYSQNTELRRQAFANFSKTLRAYQNLTATSYDAHLQNEKIMATLRGYDNVFDYLLFDQQVSQELYHRQVDGIMEKLAKPMRRYAKLIQKVYGLETLYYSDLKLPLVEEDEAISIDQAQTLISEALEIMGPEYNSLIANYREERWCDFAQNIGKSTGGFCASAPKGHPYILLSWTGLLSEVFTLIHELGHAAQSQLAAKHPLFVQQMSLYSIEAPSTAHELLLSHYLLEKADKTGDSKRRAQILAMMIANTYYHNFVTHFLEAYWQREVYRLVDAGQSLVVDDFNRLFKETLQKFWGDAVVLDEGVELTWMRQPHYYMGLYSYTYSAGLTIATDFFRRLQLGNEDQRAQAVKDWLSFLEAPGVLAPLEHAKLIGMDLSTDKPLNSCIDFISAAIDDLVLILGSEK